MSKELSSAQRTYLRNLEASALGAGSLTITKPRNLPRLLSASRSEFIISGGSFDGFYMKGIETLFGNIAKEVYDSRFSWSEYNVSQWLKFVGIEVGIEGGACMVSLEDNGDLPKSAPNTTFKGLGLGTPLGMSPYELFPISSDFDASLNAAVASFDYTPFRNRRVDFQ